MKRTRRCQDNENYSQYGAINKLSLLTMLLLAELPQPEHVGCLHKIPSKISPRQVSLPCLLEQVRLGYVYGSHKTCSLHFHYKIILT